MTREKVLWDAVPAQVRDELARRSDIPQSGHAIVENVADATWYFRRVRDGWLNLSVDRTPRTRGEVAADLPPDVQAVEKQRVAAAPVLQDPLTEEVVKAIAEKLTAEIVKSAAKTVIQRACEAQLIDVLWDSQGSSPIEDIRKAVEQMGMPSVHDCFACAGKGMTESGCCEECNGTGVLRYNPL